MSDTNVDEGYNKTMNSRDTKAKAYLSRCGYKKGGAVKEDVKKGVHEHEKHLHKGEKETKLKLKSGGRAEGRKAEAHLGKYARGGATKAKKGGTTVNVVIAPSGQQSPQKVPVPVPAPGGGGMPPPRPPMGGPPPGGAMMPPPGGGGMPPHPPMKRGGAIKKIGMVKMEAGAGGGLGRLEKAKDYGEKPLKKGGKC